MDFISCKHASSLLCFNTFIIKNILTSQYSPGNFLINKLLRRAQTDCWLINFSLWSFPDQIFLAIPSCHGQIIFWSTSRYLAIGYWYSMTVDENYPIRLLEQANQTSRHWRKKNLLNHCCGRGPKKLINLVAIKTIIQCNFLSLI